MPKPPRRSTSRPVGTRPGSGSSLASRPARTARPSRQPVRASFLQRYRSALLSGAAIVVVVGLGALFYLRATAPAYACSVEWTAPATPPPGPSETPRLGYPEEDMGRSHVSPGTAVTYLYCPPASGDHYSASGQGPIDPRLYGPNDRAVPEGWVHNLEHGALVLLYKCPGDGCTDSGQAALQQFWANFPSSPVCNIAPHLLSPVVARFDAMNYPYAALVWDQVLPLQTLDTQQILAFFSQQAERTNPEHQCAIPSATPSTGGTNPSPDAGGTSPAPSAAPSPSLAPAAS